MFRPEPLDLVVILIVVLLLFGPKRIPEIARGIGKGFREFRDGIAGRDGETKVNDPTVGKDSQV
jgi:sec-independent protein translocase protein TatA